MLLFAGLATLPACAAYEQRADLAPAPQASQPQASQAALTGKIATTRTVVVHFDSNSDDIRAAAMQIMHGAAVDLRGARLTAIRVTGHADTTGRRSYNQKLSERRAAAVAAQLGKLGLHAEVMTVKGRGEDKAKTKGVERQHADDRRVEIVFEQSDEIAAIAPTPAFANIGIDGATFPAPTLTLSLPFHTLALHPQAIAVVRSPEPLQSAAKHAIKRDLILDGTTWQPPPAV